MDANVTEEQLLAHLAPENQRQLLQLAGLYMVAYELVKTVIPENVKGFFVHGFEDGAFTYSPKWAEILTRQKHELDACLDWLLEHEVLDEADVASVAVLRDERNRVGHDFPVILVDPTKRLNLDVLISARVVLKKVAVFFGSIAADADPEFDGSEVDYDDIESMSSMLYFELLRICAGDVVPSAGDDPGAR